MNYGIIVAGGKSERMGPEVDKVFLSLGTKPVIAHSVVAFQKCGDIDGIILVVRKDRMEGARAMVRLYGCEKVKRVVVAGATRQQSVANGIAELGEDVDIVVVHDGARPCVTPDIISATIASAREFGSGVAACKITDTVKHSEKRNVVTRTIDRSKLWTVQTPQAFKVKTLRRAFDFIRKKGLSVTDEASAVEAIRVEVRLVPTQATNIKITTPDDLVLAATLLRL